MASPSQAQAPPTGQPGSPTEPSSSNPAAAGPSSQSQQTTGAPNNASPGATPAGAATAASGAAGTGTGTGAGTTPQPAQIPSTSLTDSGKTRRPRDVRLIHMLLASLGVTAYQERVPLQLLDFAYRYTSSVLQDAVHLSTEGYAGATGDGSGSGRGGGGGGGGGGSGHDVNTVSLAALRLSIASRLHYQFQTGLPKEFLMDVASERNRVALPGASRGFSENANTNKPAANQSLVMGGMRLPPERFCLTGVGWNMKEEWESDGEEEIEPTTAAGAADGSDDGQKGEHGDGDDEDGKMEDVFGEDTAMGEGSGGQGEDEDKDMTDV